MHKERTFLIQLVGKPELYPVLLEAVKFIFSLHWIFHSGCWSFQHDSSMHCKFTQMSGGKKIVSLFFYDTRCNSFALVFSGSPLTLLTAHNHL